MHTPMLRHASRFPQRLSDTVNSAPDSVPISTTPAETIAAPAPQSPGFAPRPLLRILNRTGRLTFDAMLLIVFAPVIAVWWLNEKRHKR